MSNETGLMFAFAAILVFLAGIVIIIAYFIAKRDRIKQLNMAYHELRNPKRVDKVNLGVFTGIKWVYSIEELCSSIESIRPNLLIGIANNYLADKKVICIFDENKTRAICYRYGTKKK